jgi:hypothetical protein
MYTSVNGCNTEILDLTITASTSNTTTVSSCTSYVWSVDGNTYTASGVYSSVTGCNTEILDLTINNCGGGVALNLNAFIEGYYIGSGSMQAVLANSGVSGVLGTEADTIVVELRDSLDPTVVVDAATVLLMTDGTATANFTAASEGVSYWIVIKHRSSIQTWSAAEVMMAATTSYDFTTSDVQAFGNNMKEVEPGVWALYCGDISQDEYIDNYDYPAYDSDNLNFAVGYFNTDLNGDGFVDNYDYPLYDVNNLNFVAAIHP